MDDVVEPPAADMVLPRVLAALADPQRLASVRFLARNGESWCGQVMEEAGLALSKSTFSHHLRILREAGLISAERGVTWVYYRFEPSVLGRMSAVLVPQPSALAAR